MRTILALLALVGLAVSLSASDSSACSEQYAAAVAAADSDAAKCEALLTYARCLADASEKLSAEDKLATDKLVADAHIALGKLACADLVVSKPNRISHEDGSVKLTVNENADFKFFRFRRESVSIWDLQEQYEAIVKEVRTTLSATLNSNDVAIQRQAATSDGRVTGIRTAVDILVADVAARANQVVDAANAASMTSSDVQITVNAAVAGTESARMEKQNFDLQEMRTALASDMSRSLSTILAKRNDVRARFDVGLQRLRNTVNATKQSVVDTRARISAQVQAELTRFDNIEANLNERNMYPVVTNNSLEGRACNASDLGRVFLSRPAPAVEVPVNPLSAEDNLKGQLISMPSRSHGSGYSVSMREVWNPEWSGTTIYRHDADTFTFKGTFTIGRNSIMQCAGDEQDFLYSAHWSNGVVCKFGPWPNMMTERWCYSIGCTASGVGISGNHTVATCSTSSQIWIIDRFNGQLIRTVTMQSYPGGTNYGIALMGNRMWWMYQNMAFEYEYLTGIQRRSFSLAAAPFAVYTDGEKFCISPNSDQFFCYRINRDNIYGGATALYWCDGQTNVIL